MAAQTPPVHTVIKTEEVYVMQTLPVHTVCNAVTKTEQLSVVQTPPVHNVIKTEELSVKVKDWLVHLEVESNDPFVASSFSVPACEQVVDSNEPLVYTASSQVPVALDPLRCVPSSHGTNVCVWCRSSLFRKRCNTLSEGPLMKLIVKRIAPREIPEGALVCSACWTRARRILKEQGIVSLQDMPAANTITCVCCKVKLSNKRRHSIPEGPERNFIMQKIHPREIPSGGLVCYACWVAARRNVQKSLTSDVPMTETQQDPGPSHSHLTDQCAWCHTSLFRRHTHLLSGPERDEVAERIHPNVLPQHALACKNCRDRARQYIQIKKGKPFVTVSTQTTMALNGFKHTSNSSSVCFVPGCTNVERHRVPVHLRKILLTNQKIFVTDNSRVCTEHKSVYDWHFLDQHQFSNTFTQKEIESMLNLSLQSIEINLDFEEHQMRSWGTKPN